MIIDPDVIRHNITNWANSANLTDFNDEELLDNILKSDVKPDALNSGDVLNLALNPRKTICESDLLTKIIVSENVTSEAFQVTFLLAHTNKHPSSIRDTY